MWTIRDGMGVAVDVGRSDATADGLGGIGPAHDATTPAEASRNVMPIGRRMPPLRLSQARRSPRVPSLTLPVAATIGAVPTQRLTPVLAAVLTFIATASVLVLEIAAGRLLAPYVGVSLTTYTGIIGAILAGIALGAWLGGKAADAVGPLPLLGPAFILGGFSAIASVPIVGAVGELGVGEGLVGILLLATTAFVVPAAILSATAPMLVRGTLTDLATSGSIVGRLSAVGTVGAITGTFLTGFVLLGLVPTRVLIVSIGIGLVVIGVALTLWLRRGGGDRPH